MFSARQNFYYRKQDAKAFIFDVNTSVFTFRAGANTGSAFKVDWGDGTVTNWVGAGFTLSGQRIFTHTYPAPGSYTIKILCDFYYVFFGYGTTVAGSSTQYVTNVSQWGTGKFATMDSMFRLSNTPLTFTATDKPDLSMCSRFTSMFQGHTAFNQPMNHWNTSNISSMAYMFDGATQFNQPLNNWNVNRVTEFNNMFYRAQSFDQFLNTWRFGNNTQPIDFSTGANTNWIANRATRFPCLQNGTVIST